MEERDLGEYDPSLDPGEVWGEEDLNPETYNENFMVLGSQFVSLPEYVESGLDRELGAGADEMLEREDAANIADILVDQDVWESQYQPDRVRNGNGWYAVDFRRNGGDRSYQGFLRPVEDLGWDVTLQVHENSQEPSAETTGDITVNTPSLNARIENMEEPETGQYVGHFMPYT